MFDGDHDGRRILAALSLTLVLVLAGCSGGSTPTCDVPTTVTPEDAATGETAERLRITSAYNENLTVIVRRASDNATVFAERYPDGGEQNMYFSEPFRDGEAYDVTVRTNCEVAWSETIRDGEFYHLGVNTRGQVNVANFTGG